jgi:hypothetical protein
MSGLGDWSFFDSLVSTQQISETLMGLKDTFGIAKFSGCGLAYD